PVTAAGNQKGVKKSAVSGSTGGKEASSGYYTSSSSGNYLIVTNWSASVSNQIVTVSADVVFQKETQSIPNLTLSFGPAHGKGSPTEAQSTVLNASGPGPVTITTAGPVDFDPSTVAAKISGTVDATVNGREGRISIGPSQQTPNQQNYYYFYYNILTTAGS
ncbi:MAG TPA: hypothetical protein VGM86_32305, partial [Thermoanaerobaculia bacterium]